MATADDYGLFWDSNNGDRTYNAESFEVWLKKFYYSGVFANEMQVTSTNSMSVNVGGGYCNVDGKVKEFDAQTVTLDAGNPTYPRIDTVVVERNNADRNITIHKVTGQLNGNNPSPTPPVRSGGIYQLVLAQIYVAAGATSITQGFITDTRPDKELCGYVTGTVEQIDFADVMAQYTAQFNEWFDGMKGQLSTDAAGHLQEEIDTVNTSLANVNNEIDELNDKVDNIVVPSEILNMVYPIGSYYYTSEASFDPNKSFGGTWSKLGAGRFLVSAGDGYAVNSTGGSATRSLTVNNLAAHTHGSKSLSGTFELSSGVVINQPNSARVDSSSGIVSRYNVKAASTYISSQIAQNQNNTRGVKVNATHEHTSVGKGTAFSIMPPYTAAFCWHRTA